MVLSPSLVLPANHNNFFELLAVPRSYDIDASSLEKNFKAIQKHLHPDKFHVKSQQEREFSETLASEVNRAYQTLASPVLRAHYMLSMEGAEISEAASSVQIPQEFLVQVLEIMEEVQDLAPSGAGGEQHEAQQAKLRELKLKADRVFESVQRRLSSAFSSKDIEKAKLETSKLNYFARIKDSIYEKLDSK